MVIKTCDDPNTLTLPLSWDRLPLLPRFWLHEWGDNMYPRIITDIKLRDELKPTPLPDFELNSRCKQALQMVDEQITKKIRDRLTKTVQPIIISGEKYSKDEFDLIALKIKLHQAKYSKKDKRKIKSLKNKIRKLNRKIKRYQ